MSVLEVYWEDRPAKRRKVVRYCRKCKVWPHGRPTRDNFDIVSPQGTAHLAHEYDEGNTACGKDATTGEWWWQT